MVWVSIFIAGGWAMRSSCHGPSPHHDGGPTRARGDEVVAAAVGGRAGKKLDGIGDPTHRSRRDGLVQTGPPVEADDLAGGGPQEGERPGAAGPAANRDP